jgi:two-component system cell cycle response regulator
MEFGANDFVRKPVSVIEFLARVKAQLRLKRYFDEEKRLNFKLTRMNEQLSEMAVRDYLTGIYNRRYTVEYLDTEIERCIRYGNTFALVFLDIDNFKDYNDKYGHSVGDEALKHLCALLLNNIRKSDVLGRYGGEEFLIVLHNSTKEYAKKVAKRIKDKLSKDEFIINGINLKIQASFGISSYNKGDNADKIIDRADTALYNAKNKGKNRVEIN